MTKSRSIESTKSWGKVIFTGRNEVVAKVMFLQVCVCPQGGRVSASVHAGMPYPPGPGRPPRDQTDQPPWDQADHPPMESPPNGERPPPSGTRQTTPPREADSSIRSTSGRYTSFWNAFLFQKRVSRILSAGGMRGGACMVGACMAGGPLWQAGGYVWQGVMHGRGRACVAGRRHV